MTTPPVTIGILSDTHLSEQTDSFRSLAAVCFAECQIILHAGDLTSIAILDAFIDKTVYAVHGNMCLNSARSALPRRKIISVGRFSIGLIHRAGYSYQFEDLLLNEFDQPVDCIVYGHTHLPTCHTSGGVLYINPGSFMATGSHGHPGTYALLTIGDNLHGRICRVPQLIGDTLS